MDNKCERCRSNDFNWDGQHLICKECGQVYIREKSKPIKDMSNDKNIFSYYHEMKNLKEFIDGR